MLFWPVRLLARIARAPLAALRGLLRWTVLGGIAAAALALLWVAAYRVIDPPAGPTWPPRPGGWAA